MEFSSSLSRYILDNITEKIFWRGVDYAKNGKIKSFKGEAKKISAKIAGSSIYDVEFRRGPKYVKGYCSCPYALNEDYCKHVAALAVYWDTQSGFALPTKEEVKNSCVEVEYGFGNKIEAMYRDPLHADLGLLASASDYGSWVRPHAKIPPVSLIAETTPRPFIEELRSALRKISRFESRSKYDPYFCAGEVSAVLSIIYDEAIRRLERASKQDFLAVFNECVVFYYNTYLQMIDGSDGVWQVPFSRLQYLFSDTDGRGVSLAEKAELRKELNQKISGWGDIFEDLEMQFD